MARSTVEKHIDLVVEGLFAGQRPLGRVRLEPGKKADIFRGQRMMLTRNLQKRRGHCNGVLGTVIQFENNFVTLTTARGLICVHAFRDDAVANKVFSALQSGYACTLAKVQAAELSAVAILCDVPNVPAAGYVAMSRVRREEDVIFLLPPPGSFFAPANRYIRAKKGVSSMTRAPGRFGVHVCCDRPPAGRGLLLVLPSGGFAALLQFRA